MAKRTGDEIHEVLSEPVVRRAEQARMAMFDEDAQQILNFPFEKSSRGVPREMILKYLLDHENLLNQEIHSSQNIAVVPNFSSMSGQKVAKASIGRASEIYRPRILPTEKSQEYYSHEFEKIH